MKILKRLYSKELEGLSLHPETQSFLSKFKATQTRKLESLRGRKCAQYLVQRLTGKVAPITADQDGAPVWPENIIGSISHSGDIVGACVAPQSRDQKLEILSLGYDIELTENLSLDLLGKIATEKEIFWINGAQSKQQQLIRATKIFSAKESLFKCIFPTLRKTIGFLDIELEAFDKSFQVSRVSKEFKNFIPHHCLQILVIDNGHFIETIALWLPQDGRSPHSSSAVWSFVSDINA